MRFLKMQGVGNDFVVVDQADAAAETEWPAFALRACDRHFGIGADGLLVVGGAFGPPRLSMRMFNPDGTEDMCGNGLRCLGLWAHRAGYMAVGATLGVATKDGEKRITLESTADRRSAVLTVDMGTPRFGSAEVPYTCAMRECLVNYPLAVAGTTVPISSVNTGSTHTVIFGEPPDDVTFQSLSPLIENHPVFPERTSVLWATPSGENTFDVRIWERGAGETLGCGSGACAVAVVARLADLTDPDAPIRIRSRGGSLQITWQAGSRSILMTGPADYVYHGDFA